MAPILIDRRLQTCSELELRRVMRELFDLWDAKGRVPAEQMPKVWRERVARVREECARRGVQLRLF